MQALVEEGGNLLVVPRPKKQILDEIHGEIHRAHQDLRERHEFGCRREVQGHPPEVTEEPEVHVVPS